MYKIICESMQHNFLYNKVFGCRRLWNILQPLRARLFIGKFPQGT